MQGLGGEGQAIRDNCAIEATGLTREIRPDAVLIRGVSFTVQATEVYCVLGAAGAGKTTLADIVAGLASPTQGLIRVLGRNPGDDPIEIRRAIGYVDGRGDLIGSLSPLECLSLFYRLSDGRALSDLTAVQTLREMSVPDRAMRQPLARQARQISVLVSLAVARLRRVPVLILDEPTAHLDSHATGQFLATLDVFRALKTAVFMTTDNVLVAAQAGDRVGVLKDGELLVERGRSAMRGVNVLDLYGDFVGQRSGLALDSYLSAEHVSLAP